MVVTLNTYTHLDLEDTEDELQKLQERGKHPYGNEKGRGKAYDKGKTHGRLIYKYGGTQFVKKQVILSL